MTGKMRAKQMEQDVFNQISTHAVPVQMIVTTLFAHEAEVFRIENDIIEYAFFDIKVAKIL